MELYPITQQFRTYISCGIGLCFSNINWFESLRSNIEFDSRIGGTHYLSNSLFPVFRVGTGIELGFDDFKEKNIISSVLLDVNFTYIFRYVEIYKEIAKQIKETPPNWDKLYPILPSYLSISMGISINLYRL
jgi:hypothetical protein